MIDNSKKTWHFLNYTISDWRLPQRLLLVYCFLAAAQYGKFKFGEKYYDDIVKAFNMKPPKVGTTIDVPRNEPDTERDNVRQLLGPYDSRLPHPRIHVDVDKLPSHVPTNELKRV